MYIADLTLFLQQTPNPPANILAVGWLEREFPYETGKVSPLFLEKLRRLILRENVNQMRGTHDCPFCDAEDIYLTETDKKYRLGSAELWVPEQTGNCTFAAPNLIFHYSDMHDYLPPERFVRAVEQFDFSSAWSGQAASDEADTKLNMRL